MENMDSFEKQGALSNEVKEYLLVSSKWGKFLAIVGYVGIGLMALFALSLMAGFSVFSAYMPLHSATVGAVVGFVYLAIAAVYFFPTTYLYRFSTGIKKGIEQEDEYAVTDGFRNHKKLFKFMGIFTVVILSLYAVMLVIAIPTILVLNTAV